MRRLVVLLLTIVSILFAASPAAAGQGVAVLGMNGARDDAFGLARAVYVTSLRPKKLDELRARILGGDAPLPGAAKDVKDLADLRAAVSGEDAASRQILSGIANKLELQAILVVSRPVTGGAPASDPDAGVAEEAGAKNAGTAVQARLFLAEQAEFDAARYEFDGSWNATVASVAARFPQAPAAPAASPIVVAAPQLPPRAPDKKEDRPFYKSAWLWGAIGAALVIGGIFFFATQDTSDDPIHVRMNVPR